MASGSNLRSMENVDMPALPLSEVISVDEVFLDINSTSRYALVIMDFISGEIIDILHNRWENTAENVIILVLTNTLS